MEEKGLRGVIGRGGSERDEWERRAERDEWEKKV